MAANNQGIAHLKLGSRIACRNERAHIAVSFERFATEPKPCVRCAKHYARLAEKKRG